MLDVFISVFVPVVLPNLAIFRRNLLNLRPFILSSMTFSLSKVLLEGSLPVIKLKIVDLPLVSSSSDRILTRIDELIESSLRYGKTSSGAFLPSSSTS